MDANEMQLRRDQANVWHLPVGPRCLDDPLDRVGQANNDDDAEVS
jgi:hypothetical protein